MMAIQNQEKHSVLLISSFPGYARLSCSILNSYNPFQEYVHKAWTDTWSWKYCSSFEFRCILHIIKIFYLISHKYYPPCKPTGIWEIWPLPRRRVSAYERIHNFYNVVFHYLVSWKWMSASGTVEVAMLFKIRFLIIIFGQATLCYDVQMLVPTI